MPNGSRYWRLRYRFAGKAKEFSVGRPYPELSLKDAQEEAMRLRLLIAEGTDPAEQRFQMRLDRSQRAANTFGSAAEAWFEFRTKAWANRTSSQVRQISTRTCCPCWANVLCRQLRRRELAAFSRAIESRGAPDVAKKARQWLASIFSYGRAQGWTTTDSVSDLRAVVLPSGRATNYPHLSIDELPELLRKLESFNASPIVKAAAMLSLWRLQIVPVSRVRCVGTNSILIWRCGRSREAGKG